MRSENSKHLLIEEIHMVQTNFLNVTWVTSFSSEPSKNQHLLGLVVLNIERLIETMQY